MRVGKTSRSMEFEARKVIQPLPVDRGGLAVSSAEVLAEPIVVCRARGTCVTPAQFQRSKNTENLPVIKTKAENAFTRSI